MYLSNQVIIKVTLFCYRQTETVADPGLFNGWGGKVERHRREHRRVAQREVETRFPYMLQSVWALFSSPVNWFKCSLIC